METVTNALTPQLEALLALTPRILAGLVVFLTVLLIARGVQRAFARVLSNHYGEEFGETIGSLVKGLMVFAGVLLALPVIFPSVTPATIVGSLGLSSVALGFAFKDILQNYLAGILLIFYEPFRIGDTIQIKEFRGKVTRIAIRETRLLSDEGVVIIVPNVEAYSNVVRLFNAPDRARG